MMIDESILVILHLIKECLDIKVFIDECIAMGAKTLEGQLKSQAYKLLWISMVI